MSWAESCLNCWTILLSRLYSNTFCFGFKNWFSLKYRWIDVLIIYTYDTLRNGNQVKSFMRYILQNHYFPLGVFFYNCIFLSVRQHYNLFHPLRDHQMSWTGLFTFGNFWSLLENGWKIWIWVWDWNWIWVKLELNWMVLAVFNFFLFRCPLLLDGGAGHSILWIRGFLFLN